MIRSHPVLPPLLGLFLSVTACTSYKQIQIGEVADHGKVRVTLADGERETLHGPWVDADSIKGRIRAGRPSPQLVDRAIPLDQVAELGAPGTNVAGTVTLAVLGAGLLAAVIALSQYEMCILSC